MREGGRRRAVKKQTSVADVLKALHYGLYVVGSTNGERVTTIVANWVTQVSFHPPLVLASIECESRILDYIKLSNVFSVNLLPTGSKQLAKAFIKPGVPEGESINGREFLLSGNGSPFLKDALASISCNVVQSIEAGDHTLFIGEAIEAVLRGTGDTLTLKETGWQYSR
jgi:flavin reductase (DIM6/NTAB) family NADH-FMN oxidoreductase RutF